MLFQVTDVRKVSGTQMAKSRKTNRKKYTPENRPNCRCPNKPETSRGLGARRGVSFVVASSVRVLMPASIRLQYQWVLKSQAAGALRQAVCPASTVPR